MADEKMQSQGRKDNAAQPLDAAKDNEGAERYPATGADDAVERTGRTGQVAGEPPTFAPAQTRIRNETAPPEDASTDADDVPASPQEGHLGPAGDPAEGKR
jgi:hypothetical protein